tara:strand:+ start:4285 stop:6570 length:2286 start_codon:yes stop_codon:yes gene_type:complete
MNEVIIRILDINNNVEGDLDLASFIDFPLAITKGIVNLDNLKERTGTFTKTFKVPNTKNNANLLSNVDNINSRKDYRDALNRKPCIIFVNDNPIEKGFLQVSKVFNGFNLDSFELVFFGNNIDWVKGASEKKLNSVTWRNNTQTVSSTVINIYNASSSDTYDIAFPYVSRGGNKSPQNSTVNDYYPVFYLRSVIERGLNDLGYNVESEFLTSNDIKKLVCDFPLNFIVSGSDVDATRVRATKTNANQTLTLNNTATIEFNDDSTPPNQDSNGNYNNSTYVYTVPDTANYNLLVTFGASQVVFTGNDFSPAVIKLVNNDTNAIIDQQEDSGGLEAGVGNRYQYQANFNNIALTVGTNISFRVFAQNLDGTLSALNYNDFNILGSDSNFPTYFKIERKAGLENGDVYTLNSVIPDSITLLDVINDFTRMFNIYYWTDIKTKKIYFEPRNTFFKDQTEALQWTDKLDIGNKYELDYVSSYKRTIEFSYKDLSSDEWLKEWQKINKRIYGQYKHTLPDRFAKGTTKIQLELFSASYTIQAPEVVPTTNGNYIEDEIPVTIRIWNDKEQTAPEERIRDYNSRIYTFNNGTQTALSGIGRKIKKFGNTVSNIPYGIFEAYSNVTTNVNLNYSSSNGLFNTYYSKMLKNIEEGGRLVAFFNLNSTDIENLDFRKLIYLDNDFDVRGYYLIEKVIDYKPIQNGLTKVSLFKFENLGSVSIDSSQQGNNDVDTDNGNIETFQPIYVENESQIIEVIIENPITGNFESVFN